MHTLMLITIEFAAAAHLMMSLVLFFFARRRVSYLSQAWIMLLLCLMYCAALFFIYTQDIPPLGILHPVLLLYLLATSFLQSIYPLGICMPGYLQWGRMWAYAVPALVLILLYAGGALAGSNMVKVYDPADFGHYLLSGDVILRLASLALSIYYIVNIFRLPHRLTRQVELPRWMITYGVALGLVALYFVLLTVWFSQPLVIIYIVLFTLVNMFLFFRILSPVFHALPQPPLREVAERPTEEEISHSEQNDFNEANMRRFEVLEFFMQHERPWLDCQFTRDRLCRHTGRNHPAAPDIAAAIFRGFETAVGADIHRFHGRLPVKLGIGQIGRNDAALRLEDVGQMRVVIQRNSVGAKLNDPLDRSLEALARLLGQAVDEIHVD